MDRYRVPVGTGQAELVIKDSRFIGTAGPAEDAKAASKFLETVRERYPDASHHAWAHRIPGTSQDDVASSDNGEPGGTAGRPMLAILSGSDLYEVIVVGTRYFGGTKLGTGGLVRAYGAAARAAIELAPLGEKVRHEIVELHVNYALYGAIRHEAERHDARIVDVSFAEDVLMRLAVPQDVFSPLAKVLCDASSGEIKIEDEIVASQFLLRPPK